MKLIQIIFMISILHAEISDGLIFISGHQSNISVLIDNEENIVNSWNFENNLIRSWLTSDSTIIALVGISGNRYLQKISWDGNTSWTYGLEDDICKIHHEIEILPNGNILAICREDIEAENNYYNNENLVIDKMDIPKCNYCPR